MGAHVFSNHLFHAITSVLQAPLVTAIRTSTFFAQGWGPSQMGLITASHFTPRPQYHFHAHYA